MPDAQFQTNPNSCKDRDRGPLSLKAGQEGDGDHTLFQALRSQIEEAGCFQPATRAYGIKIVLVVGAICSGYAALLADPSPIMRMGLTMLIAFATVQAGFIAHDAGDGAITKNRTVAFALRHILMSFVSALSSSYFHYLHKVHHLTLQRGGRGLGGGEYIVNPYEIGWLKRLVSSNGILFLITTVCLRGLTFKLESLRFMMRNPGKSIPDFFLIVLHALWWLVLPAAFIGAVDTAINYAFITLFAGPYVGTILILNHEGMASARDQMHLPLIERVTRSTRNLGQSRFADLVYGGVNNHIEHHLFPQIPGIRLRQARSITRAFCKKHGIDYAETSFMQALVDAAGHFRRISPQRLATESLS